MTATTDQLLDNIRVHVPGAVDPAIELELFNTIDEVTRHHLQSTPPAPGSALSTWLTDAEYKEYFQLLVDGTTARLLSQLGKPYTNPQVAALHEQKYYAAVARARDDVNSTIGSSLVDRLLDNARTQLPAAKDGVIEAEVFNTVNDFCRDALAWRETIAVPFVSNQPTYDITPTGTDIVSVISIGHDTRDMTGALYEFGKITLDFVPGDDDEDDLPFFVIAALTPALTAGDDLEAMIPADMWSEHYQTFLDGVIGRMMLQPQKPYTNPQLGQLYMRRYTSRRTEARHKVRVGGVPGGQLWRYPRWTR